MIPPPFSGSRALLYINLIEKMCIKLPNVVVVVVVDVTLAAAAVVVASVAVATATYH